jgi:hypothetical protein
LPKTTETSENVPSSGLYARVGAEPCKRLGFFVVGLRHTFMYSLISFADGPFQPRAARFAAEAASLEVFDRIDVFRKEDLPQGFLSQHGSFLRGRGFGYWIWKPVVIAETLARRGPDDVVVYLDVGFTLTPSGRDRMLEYLSICRDSVDKMLSFMSVYTEEMWTKADLAVRLGVHDCPGIMATSQLAAGFLVLGNTASNRDLVNTWAELAVEDVYHFSDDSPSHAPNHHRFQEHRHDASISSLLRKVRGTSITHYEVQSYEAAIPAMRERVPAWAARLRE